MPTLRGIENLLADLDARARRTMTPRNRVVQKLVSVADTVAASSDSVTITLSTQFTWASSTGTPPTTNELAWSMGEWAG